MSSSSLQNLPPEPRSVHETGLSLNYLSDLALKTLYIRGTLLGRDIAEMLALPFMNVLDQAMQWLRRERLIEVGVSPAGGEALYRYIITSAGRLRARELLNQNQYVGPAPVNLTAYSQMVKLQSLAGRAISPEALKSALAHLVLGDDILTQLGPAINTGRSIFLHGHTGNGKTSIGLAIETLLPGAIWIPYAVSVYGQIIQVYDPQHHRPLASSLAKPGRRGMLSYLNNPQTEESSGSTADRHPEWYDRRWVLIRRPLIVGGGELTLRNLELVFDPATKYYHAPQQMKANGGVFLVDDLGRQRASPREILNRWIVPLEQHADHLALAIGSRIDVPFDVLIVFATNLNPLDLVDEAFLRRIRNKIHIPDPTRDQFREILVRETARQKVPYSEEGFEYLFAEYYEKANRQPRGVHPRDILDGVIEAARFRGVPPTLSKELVDAACETYFIQVASEKGTPAEPGPSFFAAS